METILIATDFSKSANHAAKYVAQFGMQLKAKQLLLYHSYELLPISADIPEGIALSDGRMHARSMELLEDLKQELLVLTNKEITIQIVANSSNLERGINDLAVEHGANLVAIGLSAKGTWEKLLVGSSTKKLLNTCHLPLFIVPASANYIPVSKIVMGCDLENVAASIPAGSIRHLIEKLHAQLLVVNVDHHEEQHFDADMIRQQSMFYDLFEDLNSSIHYIDHESIDKGILAYTEKHEAQLIIVVAKKHSLLERITKESISKKLASTSQVPLLIFKL